MKLITPPAAEPVPLDGLKLHCRVDGDEEDTLIRGLGIAARTLVEEETGRALVTQTWELTLPEWPGCDDGYALTLPLPPLQSVTSVKYLDGDEDEQTLDADAYRVGLSTRGEGTLTFVPASLPAVASREDAIRVRFVAGYGYPDDVPETLKVAIGQLTAQWYRTREGNSEKPLREVPLGVQRLINLHALRRVK